MLWDNLNLNSIGNSFIRPIIEYGDTIWDNCTLQEKQELEKLQLEATRIATGASKLVSIQKPYEVVRWDTLDTRRYQHKLTFFYKMCFHITSPYLSSLVPSLVSNVSRYSLRNANDISTIDTRTSLYFHSFLPSVIRDWNSLPLETRNTSTIQSFK